MPTIAGCGLAVTGAVADALETISSGYPRGLSAMLGGSIRVRRFIVRLEVPVEGFEVAAAIEEVGDAHAIGFNEVGDGYGDGYGDTLLFH